MKDKKASTRARKLARLKARKPKLIRQESWRYARIKDSWRRPKGVTSKMRLGLRGWPKRVSVGYKNPASLRYLHPSMFVEVMAHNTKDLEGLNPEKHVIRIGHTVGERKRVTIMDRARGLGIRVLNPRVTRAVEAVVPEPDQIESQSTESESVDLAGQSEEDTKK
jgi:large subunit ribosomal protein L32e